MLGSKQVKTRQPIGGAGVQLYKCTAAADYGSLSVMAGKLNKDGTNETPESMAKSTHTRCDLGGLLITAIMGTEEVLHPLRDSLETVTSHNVGAQTGDETNDSVEAPSLLNEFDKSLNPTDDVIMYTVISLESSLDAKYRKIVIGINGAIKTIGAEILKAVF